MSQRSTKAWRESVKGNGNEQNTSNGYPRYETWYYRELAAFKRMHDRIRDKPGYDKLGVQWKRNPEGFDQFLNYIGLIPDNLNKPSLGRKNHSIGYFEGNIMWEEHAFNSIKRRGTKYES